VGNGPEKAAIHRAQSRRCAGPGRPGFRASIWIDTVCGGRVGTTIAIRKEFLEARVIVLTTFDADEAITAIRHGIVLLE
jgi:hypothetical protein